MFRFLHDGGIHCHQLSRSLGQLGPYKRSLEITHPSAYWND